MGNWSLVLIAGLLALGVVAEDDVRASSSDGASVLSKPVAPKTRQAKIDSDMTYYDRKEGMAVFTGKVHVDDDRYQMHADRAYVFLDGTNALHRIVALGHVALTNEEKRAYGAKASYYRQNGMVVLSGDDTCAAEVRDESKDGKRIVRGRKIKFWIDSEQVEVLEASIEAPSNGKNNINSIIR